MENLYDENDLVDVKIKTETLDEPKDKKYKTNAGESSSYGAL
jgi:hypothetical protein